MLERSATGRLAPDQVIEVYDALAEVYADHYVSGNPDRPFLEEFLSHLRTGTRLLDVGCGTGNGAEYFSDHGMRVEGIDLSGSMIEVATRTYPHISFTRKDIRNSNYRLGHFDAIWAGYSLFHMGREDFQTVLRKIRKALVADGIFGLIMQEGKGDVQFPELLCPGKSLLVCLYSREELTAILAAHGFKVIARKRRGPVSALEYPYKKLLEDNADAYEFASNLRIAGNLKGHLLLIHGTSDVNVPFTATIQMIDALERAGKPYDLVVLPEQSHAPTGQAATYYQEALKRYLVEHLNP